MYKKVGPKSEPLSLLYIATYLNQNNHKAEVIDCEAEGISLTELEQHIRKGDYDCVGVAMLTPLYTQAVNVCKLTKQVNPKIKTKRCRWNSLQRKWKSNINKIKGEIRKFR